MYALATENQNPIAPMKSDRTLEAQKDIFVRNTKSQITEKSHSIDSRIKATLDKALTDETESLIIQAAVLDKLMQIIPGWFCWRGTHWPRELQASPQGMNVIAGRKRSDEI